MANTWNFANVWCSPQNEKYSPVDIRLSEDWQHSTPGYKVKNLHDWLSGFVLPELSSFFSAKLSDVFLAPLLSFFQGVFFPLPLDHSDASFLPKPLAPGLSLPFHGFLG